MSNATRERHPGERQSWCTAMIVALAFIATVVQHTTDVAADAPVQSAAMVSTATTCQNLTNLKLPNATVTFAAKATTVPAPAGGGGRSEGQASSDPPAFCRVALTLKPSYDSDIRAEVWMPLTGWNGKLHGIGNGGYAGSIRYAAMADSLRMGYAVASTDMGTGPADGTRSQGIAALPGHPERWIDFGYRSTHEMTVDAKEIIRTFYGDGPSYSYFSGCSTGGFQGLREVQRFPEDYNGYLVGAPGIDRARQHMAMLWNAALVLKNPQHVLSVEKLKLVNDAVLAACATKYPGGRTDPFVQHPNDCNWSPEALRCQGSSSEGCLTQGQVDLVHKLYSGPVNARTGEVIYPGFTRGSELGWSSIMNTKAIPYLEVFTSVFGPHWDWRTFDWDKDVATLDTVSRPIIATLEVDLTRAQQLGNKILMYKGYSDLTQAPGITINYYKAVIEDLARRSELDIAQATDKTQEFFRFFMFPGMGHCGGGPAPDTHDGFNALTKWVETGLAPDQMTASHRNAEGVVDMTRPVCPFPLEARYKGAGDPSDASSFACVKTATRTW